MDQAYSEVENTDPEQHQRWLDKHGFTPDENGNFKIDNYEGKTPVTVDTLFENIKHNVSCAKYTPLYSDPFDDRTFVMVCGGPSLERHISEIRKKALAPEEYLVVCSNMTGKYLLENGIVAHAHFIIDPQEKKKYDLSIVSPATQYWINVACHPAVFDTLKESGIQPYAFLADFDIDGKAIQAVKDSMTPGQPGMMAIQGGTMAGLRAINLADALGFRKMEYYGFDATVEVADGKAKPYAYDKKRGEAIIEITCDKCGDKFDTTLIFQKQVNEFVKWHRNMPWMDIKIIGGGLIDHYFSHVKALEDAQYHSKERYSAEYAAIQKDLHAQGSYGVTGRQYVPTIFHGISQLAKRLGSVTVLDYGSSSGDTMKAVREHLWIPPSVTDRCYDPFVAEYAAEPEPADFIICTDVLEHVEPECTKAVLDHIASLTKRIAFFSISLKPANKTLSDGRNAHINLASAEYWLTEIKKRFITSEAKVDAAGEVVLAIAQSIDDVKQRTKEINGRRAA